MVIGQFADHLERQLTGGFTGSRYASSDQDVVRVTSDGLVQVMGNGKAVLTVGNGGIEGVLDVIVTADSEPNRPPVARVSNQIVAKARSVVVLNGSRVVILTGTRSGMNGNKFEETKSRS